MEHGGVEPWRLDPQHVATDWLESLVAEQAGCADAGAVEDVVVPGELLKVHHSFLYQLYSPILKEAVQRWHGNAWIKSEGGESLPNPVLRFNPFIDVELFKSCCNMITGEIIFR